MPYATLMCSCCRHRFTSGMSPGSSRHSWTAPFSYLVPDFITNPVKSRLAPEKKLVFILAQNNPDRTSFPDIFPKFDFFFKTFGFAERHLIRAFGLYGPGEVLKEVDVLELAERTAQQVCA